MKCLAWGEEKLCKTKSQAWRQPRLAVRLNQFRRRGVAQLVWFCRSAESSRRGGRPAGQQDHPRPKLLIECLNFRGVAQLVARRVWDAEVARSNRVTPTRKFKLKNYVYRLCA